MKKRSLFAAVAMLIVSAIVLTSATYAWFAASSTIDIASFTATTDATSGGLVVSASGNDGTWVTQLTKANYQNDSGSVTNVFPTSDKFEPVTGNIDASDALTLKTGSLAGTTFTWADATATAGYIQYTTFVMSPSSNGLVEVKPTLAKSSADGAANLAKFIYYYATIENVTTTGSTVSGGTVAAVSKNYKANALESRSYNAIVSGTAGNYNDGDSNGIISSAEASALTITSQGTFPAFAQANANTALQFNAVAGAIYKITVTVWAEGQDATCVSGSGSACSAQVGLGLSLTV